MYSIQNYSMDVQTIKATTTPAGISETELEQTIGISLLADYNEQLSAIAETMQENLEAKEEIQEEITDLELLNSQETTEIDGEDYIELSTEEYEDLLTEYPDLNYTEQDGTYYVAEDSLESIIASQQEELATLNTTSELISLQIQSLVDQRKNAITLLSNLMSNHNDILMTIINNMKN